MALNLTWSVQNGIHTLGRQGSKAVAISVIPDPTHPMMWRIRTKDGSLSDMANLTRSKDAAAAIVKADYDSQMRME
jgi:hypothetical protein